MTIGISPDTTITIRNLDSLEAEIDTDTLSDFFAVKMAYWKQGNILDGESRVIEVHTEAMSKAIQNRKCGTMFRWENNGSIFSRVIGQELIPKLGNKITASSWSNPDHYDTTQYSSTYLSGAVYFYNLTEQETISRLKSQTEGVKSIMLRSNGDGFSLWDEGDTLENSTEPSPWVPTQGASEYARLRALFKDWKDGGVAEINFALLDDEVNPWNVATLATESTRRADLEADSRFAPILTEIGETDLDWIPTEGSTPRTSWFNRIMKREMNMEICKYILKPLWEFFPTCLVGNYDGYISDRLAAIPRRDAFTSLRAGVATGGNVQAPRIYGDLQGSWTGTLDGYTLPTKDAFLALINTNQMARHNMRASEIPVVPWVGAKYQVISGTNQLQNNLFWDEHIRQLIALGVQRFYYFNPTNGNPEADQLFDDLLTEGNEKKNGKTWIPITTAFIPWDTTFLYSGVKIPEENKTLFRVSVRTGVESITVNGIPYSINHDLAKGIWHEDTLNTTSLTIVDTT